MRNNYILWIIGGLFVYVSGIAGLVAKLGLIMFQWRREIDMAINENSIKLASMGVSEGKIARNEKEIEELRMRVSQMRERKTDDMDDDR